MAERFHLQKKDSKRASKHRANGNSLLEVYRHEQMNLAGFDHKVELMRKVLPEHAHLNSSYIAERKRELQKGLLRIKAAIVKHGGNMRYEDWLLNHNENDTANMNTSAETSY